MFGMDDLELVREALPMVHAEELAALAARYGAPGRHSFRVQADDYIYTYRFGRDSDRRAEVVFAIEDPQEGIWVHAKPHYPDRIFRLPSGGVQWDESVEHALLREVAEETGLDVEVMRFLALVEYEFYRDEATVPFASYVFHLKSSGGTPIFQEGEPISAFYGVPPSKLASMADQMRALNGDRRGWGQWRALAHDVVSQYLTE